jgi:hypothetical protein
LQQPEYFDYNENPFFDLLGFHNSELNPR